jgi:hypothetical protein
MRREIVPAGILLGLGVLARPDFVIWVACAVAWLFFSDRARRGDAVRTLLIALAVVLPWIVFTSAYYGSPIPHTLVAKSTAFAQLPSLGAGPGTWLTYFRESLARHGQEWANFAPFLDYHFATYAPGYWWIRTLAYVVIALTLTGLWVSRRYRELWPLIAYALIFYAYQLLIKGVAFFPWYLPPLMAVVALMVAIGITRVMDYVPRGGAVFAGFLALAFALPLPWYFQLERNVQRIDDRVRTNVGLYLKAHMRRGEAVTSESAGYIGYYGRNVRLEDFPGLTSPTSEKALRKLPPERRDLINLIAVLQPKWLTLRTPEAEEFRARYPQIAARYDKAAFFSVPESETPTHIGKINWLNLDREFYVLRKRD